ncbi:hypothetical protein [Streptosporangium sp. CA-115845]|uniref:hypothetical protein n=1 Tax=Streptosporangium sp. CA-115845 TaxID=3240071 RepID=UPI003D9106E8
MAELSKTTSTESWRRRVPRLVLQPLQLRGSRPGGIDRGHWEHYTCSEGDWFWHLWTNR